MSDALNSNVLPEPTRALPEPTRAVSEALRAAGVALRVTGFAKFGDACVAFAPIAGLTTGIILARRASNGG